MVFALAFSTDGKVLASAEGNNSPGFRGLGTPASGYGVIRLWDPGSGKELRRLEGHRGVIRSLAFSPNGKFLVSAGDDKQIRLWAVSTGQDVQQVSPGAIVHCVVFSPDGSNLAWSGPYHAIHLWDIVRNKEVRSLRGPKGGAVVHAFSPDGKTLAAGSSEGVYLWDVNTGRLLHHLR